MDNFDFDFDFDLNIFQDEKPRHPEGWYKSHYEARKFLKDKCECCDYELELVAHHIDQDYMNNIENNIQTLCKYCHNFWHKLLNRLDKSAVRKMPCLYNDIKST